MMEFARAFDYGIRTADIEDLPRLIPLAREFYAQSQFLRNFDPDRFVGMWTDLLEREVGEIFLLTDAGGTVIVGHLGGVIYPEPYSGERIATEFFWYVHQGFRGGGMKLYRAFEDWARRKGCSQIRMVHLMDSMPEKLQRVYMRLGYIPAEVHYTKSLTQEELQP